jgi:Rho-binding antiterminator
MSEKYNPIACGLYDRLETEATLKRTVRLTVKEDNATELQVVGLINTFSAHDGVEHLIMEDGTKIRLDKVTHLNGELFVTNFC